MSIQSEIAARKAFLSRIIESRKNLQKKLDLAEQRAADEEKANRSRALKEQAQSGYREHAKWCLQELKRLGELQKQIEAELVGARSELG